MCVFFFFVFFRAFDSSDTGEVWRLRRRDRRGVWTAPTGQGPLLRRGRLWGPVGPVVCRILGRFVGGNNRDGNFQGYPRKGVCRIRN